MSRQIDQKTTKQVRIDINWHKYAKTEAAKSEISLKSLVEAALAEYMEGDKDAEQ